MLDFLFRKSTGFFLLVILLIVTGIIVLLRLPVMMYPQTRRPQVMVQFSHPGISAVDFQDQYSETIENSLMSLSDLDLLETTYSTDSSWFGLTFNWNVESEEARTEVENLMVTVNSTLPTVIQDSYSVRYWQGENAGYLVMGLTSKTTPSEELYYTLKNNIEPRLLKIEDLEEIGFYNTRRLIVEIQLEQLKMLSYGITINDVNTALQSGFLPQPLGSLDTGDDRFSIRLERNEKSLDQLSRLEIKQVGNSRITLDDIAQMDIRYTLPNRVFLVKGEPAVQLTATPEEGGNVNTMTREIEDILHQGIAEGLIPEDTQMSLYLDPAKYISKSIENVIQAALIGGLLAVTVVFLILGEWKNTLLIAASLPVTIIISFLFMQIFGVSINLISLGGLALAVGMIVDSTIVVMENIHRHRLESDGAGRILQWRRIVIDAVDQVRSPVIASTLTSVLVFLPISFTAPLTNAILGDQARTVVFALMGSLLVSLTLVPVLAFYAFLGHQRKGPVRSRLKRGDEKIFRGLSHLYGTSLLWILQKKRRAAGFLLLAFGVLAVSLLLIMPRIPREIIATPTSDRVVLFFRNSEISDPEVYMNEIIPEMNAKIDEALDNLLSEKYANLYGRFNQYFLDLHSSDDTEEAIARLQDIFVSEGDWYYNVMAWDPAALPLPRSFDFQMSLFGPDAQTKVELLASIQTILNEEEIFRRTFTEPSSSIVRQLNLKSREETIDSFSGLSESTLTQLIRRVLNGTSTITLIEDSEDVDISASYPEDLVNSRQKLEDFLIPWEQQFIPLKHFFNFSETSGVSQVYSENGEPTFRVYGLAGFRISDSKRLEMQQQAQTYLEKNLVLPEGYSYTFDNPRIEMDNAIRSLFVALAISIVLIYLLLAFQFNSLWIPLVILVTIPLGFVGVVFSLWIFKSTLNLNSLLGTILLGGIVVNNAIILIDFYLKSRLEFSDYREALIHAARIRFQPIIITTMTTIFGMLPLAIGLGEGSNILQPLGIAVSGGLLVSTLMALYAVPSLLVLTHSNRKSYHHKERDMLHE